MADSGHDEILNILDLKPKHKKKVKLFSLTLQYILVFPGLKDANIRTASKDIKYQKYVYFTPLGCLHMQSNIKKKTKHKHKKTKIKKNVNKEGKSLALAFPGKMDVKK